jgi:KDO2-lipid IV(A) lauroyltransferase
LVKQLEYRIVLAFVALAKILPKSWLYGLFHGLGVLLFWTLKKRRQTALNNLARAYPDCSENTITTLAKANFTATARTVADILLLLNERFDMEAHIVNGEEVLAHLNALQERHSKSIIFTTAHFSNWELLAQFLAKHGYPMTAVGRRGTNRLIEYNLTTPFRERYGNKNIFKQHAMTHMVKTLRNGGNVGLLIDQKANARSGAKTTFFGLPCYTTTSVASMKLRYDALVVPMFILREKEGNYRILFEGEANPSLPQTLSKEEKVVALTQHYNDIFERTVRQTPEQWFWMHNRWKL